MVKENLAMMEYADSLGFDSVWLVEHHFSEYGVLPSAQMMAAAIAQRTKKVRIGTAVVVLPFNHPIRVAEEVALADILSNGRIEFGVGRGYQRGEFAGFNIPMDESRERFAESLDIILKAWTTERFSYEGKYFRVDDVSVLPKPVQQPHPPIWMAAVSPETYQFVGQHGYSLLFHPPFTQTAKGIEAYRKGLEEGGHDPRQVEVGGLVQIYVDKTMEQARRVFEEPCLWYYRTLAELVAPPQGQPTSTAYAHYPRVREAIETVTFDQICQFDGVIVGDPEHCIEKISRLQEAYGITHLLCWTRMGGLDHRKVMQSMELMVSRLFPWFRS